MPTTRNWRCARCTASMSWTNNTLASRLRSNAAGTRRPSADLSHGQADRLLCAALRGFIPHALLRCRQRRRSEEHTSELQSQSNLVCRLLLEKKKKYEAYIHFYIFTNSQYGPRSYSCGCTHS